MASFFLNKVNAIKIRSPLNRISFLNSISCQQAHNHCSVCQGLQEGRMPGLWPPSLDTALMQEASRGVQKSRCSVPPANPSAWQKTSASLLRQLYGCSEFQEKFREVLDSNPEKNYPSFHYIPEEICLTTFFPKLRTSLNKIVTNWTKYTQSFTK